MMRTASAITNAAAALGLGPAAPPRRALLLLVSLLVAAGTAAALIWAPPPQPGDPPAAEPSPGEPAAGEPVGLERSLPQRVLIPALEVDSRVAPLSLQAGELATVPARQLTGWYRGGTSPGEPGSAVLLGYLDWPGPEPAAFAGLERLAPGDRVDVLRADGRTARFTVEQVEPYSSARSYPGGNGQPLLRLVGTRGPAHGSVPELVVFASLAR